MKPWYVVIASLQLSCSIGSSSLSLSTGEGQLVADGASQRAVTVCNTSDEPADSVTATLLASTGSWIRATSSDVRSIEIPLTSRAKCVEESWLPPTKPGPARFEVHVGQTVELREDVNLVAATVNAITILAAPPVLSSTGAFTNAVRIQFTTATDGEASEGTIVDVKLMGSDPPGAAAIEDGPIVVGKRDSLNLITAMSTTSVQLHAELRGSNGKVQSCRVLSPLSTVATLNCQE